MRSHNFRAGVGRQTICLLWCFLFALLGAGLVPGSRLLAEEHNETPWKDALDASPRGEVVVTGYAYYDLARSIIPMVNDLRKSLGIAPLTYNVNLEQAAMVRAAETSMLWSHMRPDGTYIYESLPYCTGENIAAGNTKPEEVFQQWVDSEPHYRAMVNPQYRSIGVGAFGTAEGEPPRWWSQIFSLDLGEDASNSDHYVQEIFPVKMTVGTDLLTLKVIQSKASGGIFDLSQILKDMSYRKRLTDEMHLMATSHYDANDPYQAHTTLDPSMVVWSSSQPDILSVDDQGITHPKSYGKVEITCTMAGDLGKATGLKDKVEVEIIPTHFWPLRVHRDLETADAMMKQVIKNNEILYAEQVKFYEKYHNQNENRDPAKVPLDRENLDKEGLDPEALLPTFPNETREGESQEGGPRPNPGSPGNPSNPGGAPRPTPGILDEPLQVTKETDEKLGEQATDDQGQPLDTRASDAEGRPVDTGASDQKGDSSLDETATTLPRKPELTWSSQLESYGQKILELLSFGESNDAIRLFPAFTELDRELPQGMRYNWHMFSNSDVKEDKMPTIPNYTNSYAAVCVRSKDSTYVIFLFSDLPGDGVHLMTNSAAVDTTVEAFDDLSTFQLRFPTGGQALTPVKDQTFVLDDSYPGREASPLAQIQEKKDVHWPAGLNFDYSPLEQPRRDPLPDKTYDFYPFLVNLDEDIQPFMDPNPKFLHLSSSDPSVATLSETGLLTVLKNGETTLKAQLTDAKDPTHTLAETSLNLTVNLNALRPTETTQAGIQATKISPEEFARMEQAKKNESKQKILIATACAGLLLAIVVTTALLLQLRRRKSQ